MFNTSVAVEVVVACAASVVALSPSVVVDSAGAEAPPLLEPHATRLMVIAVASMIETSFFFIIILLLKLFPLFQPNS